jgi:hypothetical protein
MPLDTLAEKVTKIVPVVPLGGSVGRYHIAEYRKFEAYFREITWFRDRADPPDGVKVTEDIVTAEVLLFQDIPTSISRSAPVPVVWVQLIEVPLAAVVKVGVPSTTAAAYAAPFGIPSEPSSILKTTRIEKIRAFWLFFMLPSD